MDGEGAVLEGASLPQRSSSLLPFFLFPPDLGHPTNALSACPDCAGKQALLGASLAAPDPMQDTDLDQIITQMDLLNSGELWEGASVMGPEEVLLALVRAGEPRGQPLLLCPSR